MSTIAPPPSHHIHHRTTSLLHNTCHRTISGSLKKPHYLLTASVQTEKELGLASADTVAAKSAGIQ
ncbi:hypothetical protein HanPSC8_Chr13g0587781 [Helianthus annuus]|nr:hypothetical protein HanPSC8_Chr13g0587781 [Helianthus annuus]